MGHAKFEDKPRLNPDLMMSLVDSIDDAVFVLDMDGHFLYVNQKAEELWERHYQDLIGKSIWQTYPQLLETETADSIIEAFKTGESAHFETVSPILHRWISVRTCSIEPHGVV